MTLAAILFAVAVAGLGLMAWSEMREHPLEAATWGGLAVTALSGGGMLLLAWTR